MQQTDAVVPVERKGGVERTSSPHQCVYKHNGADAATCSELTRLYQRNVQGCCVAKCTSINRLCYKCLELGARNPGKVTNPTIGLCEQHTGGRREPAQESANRNPSWLRTLGDKEIASMPRSTPEECERLVELSEGERQVLHWLAYGFDVEYVDRQLTKNDIGVHSVADALPTIFRKLELDHLERERDRFVKACKILIDGNDRKREGMRLRGAQSVQDPTLKPAFAEEKSGDEAQGETQEKPVLRGSDQEARFDASFKDPSPAHELDTPDRTRAGDDQDEIDRNEGDPAETLAAGGVEAPATAARAQADPTSKQEHTQMQESDELQDARQVAASYAGAETKDQRPHITDVYTAVRAFVGADMTKTETGELFGYTGTGGVSWVTSILSLEKLSQLAWKAIGAQHLPHAFLFNLCALSGTEQVEKIKKRLSKKDGASKKPPKNLAAKPKKAASERVARKPRAAKKQRKKPAEVSLPVPAKPAAVVPLHDVQGKGNGASVHTHTLASLLPVMINLIGFEDFVDIDLVATKFGPEASEQRIAMIAQQRERGYHPASIAVHPAIQSQMIFIKRV